MIQKWKTKNRPQFWPISAKTDKQPKQAKKQTTPPTPQDRPASDKIGMFMQNMWYFSFLPLFSPINVYQT